MDVREKLVELLNEMQDSGIVETPAGFGFTKQYIENDKIASHLFAHGVTVQEWISVTERLPETELVRYRDEAEPSGYGEYYASEVVLVFATNHKIYLAIYCESNESNWWDSDAGLYEDVTHWMPLPEPPKEVE